MTNTFKSEPHYLHFPDQATWQRCWAASALSELELESGEYCPIHRCHIVEVGEIRRGGEWDEQGIEIVAPEVLPGYHVNILLENDLVLPAELEEHLLPKPNQPHMIWSCEQDE